MDSKIIVPQKKTIIPNLFHMHFETQEGLNQTFLRFQEHYESPNDKFRNGPFTLEEFKEWYISNSVNGKKSGLFTYYTDWNGCNFPSNNLKLFFQGKFNPLSKLEKDFLNQFMDINSDFYVIGTWGNSEQTKQILRHEVAHGMYKLNKEYYEDIKKELLSMNPVLKKRIFDFLSSDGGYSPEVCEDEIHAHLIEDIDKLKNKGNIYGKNVELTRKRFRIIFSKYAPLNLKYQI